MRTRCYSDYLAHALELCEHWPNLRLVFAGAIKEKADKVNNPRELVVGLPLERLLIETDGHTSENHSEAKLPILATYRHGNVSDMAAYRNR